MKIPKISMRMTLIDVVVPTVTALGTVLLCVFALYGRGGPGGEKSGEQIVPASASDVSEGKAASDESAIIKMKLYRFILDEDHRDRGYHYYETEYSVDDYGAAIITDVKFWSECDVFNHGWSISPRKTKNGKWGILLSAGNCNRVNMAVFFIKGEAFDGGTVYWGMPDVKKKPDLYKPLVKIVNND